MGRYIKKRLGLFLLVLLLMASFNAIAAGQSILRQRLLDGVIALDRGSVQRYIPMIIAVSAGSALLLIAFAVLKDRFSALVINDIRCRVFSGIMGRSYQNFTSVNTGDYVSAVTNDLRAIQGQFFGMLFMAVLSGLSCLLNLVLMLYYSVWVALGAAVGAVVLTTVPMLLGRFQAKLETRRSEKLATFTALLSDLFAGFEVVTSFGVLGHVEKKFQQASGEIRDAGFQANAMSSFSQYLGQFLSAMTQVTLLGLMCVLVLSGGMTPGALMVCTSLSTNFCGNLTTLFQVVALLQGVQPVIQRVNALVDSPAAPSGQAVPSLEKELTVSGLTFGYEEDALVLQNASFSLKPGGKYALVGESGCGKTTLLHLLTGDFQNYQGQILYDGQELRSLDSAGLHKLAAVIQQEVFLFDDTIANNICLYDDFSPQALSGAMDRSGVSKFLSRLPEGRDYPVGQRGERLSGGQRQRIAIARALIRGTRFLILDEGTSALDEETAEEIESALLDMPELTLLTITHHLRHQERYDGILAMEKGKVIAGFR